MEQFFFNITTQHDFSTTQKFWTQSCKLNYLVLQLKYSFYEKIPCITIHHITIICSK